jgi:hypothetical protein
VSGVEREHREDGSIAFIATLDAADALRSAPAVLDTLEEAMASAVAAMTGEEALQRRRPWRRFGRHLLGVAKGFVMLAVTLFVVCVGIAILVYVAKAGLTLLP